MIQSQYIVSQFGGASRLARALNKTPSTIQRWQQSGYIPGRHYAAIFAAARAHDIAIDLAKFVPESTE